MMKNKALLISMTIILLHIGFSALTPGYANKLLDVPDYKNPNTQAGRYPSAPSLLQQDAFNHSVKNALPLSPEQIAQLRKQFNQTQAAVSAHPEVPPKPVTTLHLLDLSSGSTPMVIRLAQGYVTALVFVDSTNQPWPVESYTIGDPEAFNIQWDKKSNLLMVQSHTLYKNGNLAVKLKNLNVPIMLTFLPDQQSVDYRVDIRVPQEGPNAKPYIDSALPEQISADLLNVLDGIPPKGSKWLRVTGGDPQSQAWLGEKYLYLRTRCTISSPAWLSMVSSADGMHAYELPRMPCILGLYKGKKMQLRVEGL